MYVIYWGSCPIIRCPKYLKSQATLNSEAATLCEENWSHQGKYVVKKEGLVSYKLLYWKLRLLIQCFLKKNSVEGENWNLSTDTYKLAIDQLLARAFTSLKALSNFCPASITSIYGVRRVWPIFFLKGQTKLMIESMCGPNEVTRLWNPVRECGLL